jgi:hypothetical protein
MATQVEEKKITVEHHGHSYSISYNTMSNIFKSDFNITVNERELSRLIGKTFTYTLSFKDGLEELDYPPINGEEDLQFKKLIIEKIFINEGINLKV